MCQLCQLCHLCQQMLLIRANHLRQQPMQEQQQQQLILTVNDWGKFALQTHQHLMQRLIMCVASDFAWVSCVGRQCRKVEPSQSRIVSTCSKTIGNNASCIMTEYHNQNMNVTFTALHAASVIWFAQRRVCSWNNCYDSARVLKLWLRTISIKWCHSARTAIAAGVCAKLLIAKLWKLMRCDMGLRIEVAGCMSTHHCLVAPCLACLQVEKPRQRRKRRTKKHGAADASRCKWCVIIRRQVTLLCDLSH